MEWRQYELNSESIDRISEWIQQTCGSRGVNSRKTQQIRLTAEDLLIRLLKNREQFPIIDVGIGKQMLCLRYAGIPYDPREHSADDWSDSIMDNLGLSPSWRYRRQVNRISIEISQRTSHGATFGIITSALAAVLFGLLGRLLPESVRSGLDSVLLAPTAAAFLGLLNTFAGIMIALSICGGILGMGDSSTLRKTGKHFLLRIVLLCFLSSVFALTISGPLLGLRISDVSQSQTSQFAKISEMLFSILPSDPVSPFLNKNTMQVIVIALLLGVGLLAIGDRAGRLRELIDDGTQLFSSIMMMICRFIPVYIFTALLRQIWFGDLKTWLSLWKPILLINGIFALFLLISLIIASRRLHTPARRLAEIVAPPSLVAFTTASSIAAFQSSMETGKEKLGIDPSFLQFAYPIGTVMYMPGPAICLTVFCVYFAIQYGVAVNASWLIAAVFIPSLLAIAVPPLPGSGLMIFSTMYAQLGIPAEALLLTTLMYVVLDHFVAGGDIAALLIELTQEAGDLHRSDRNIKK